MLSIVSSHIWHDLQILKNSFIMFEESKCAIVLSAIYLLLYSYTLPDIMIKFIPTTFKKNILRAHFFVENLFSCFYEKSWSIKRFISVTGRLKLTGAPHYQHTIYKNRRKKTQFINMQRHIKLNTVTWISINMEKIKIINQSIKWLWINIIQYYVCLWYYIPK